MGKEKTTVANATSTVVTADNVMNVINQENFIENSLTKSVMEDVKKEQDERKKREIKSRYLSAKYQMLLALLQLRRQRKIDDLTKTKVRIAGRLLRFLMGFTFTEQELEFAKTPDTLFEKETLDEKAKTLTLVGKDGKKTTYKIGDEVPSIIDIVDYDNMKRKLQDDLRKQSNEIDKVYQDEVTKLDASFGDYWCSSWRW